MPGFARAKSLAPLALGFAVAASVFFAPRTTYAIDCGSPLVSTCINDDNLWPHAGAGRFLTIGSTETVTRGQLGFGLVTSYLSRPLILHIPSPGPDGSDQYVINDQVNASFLFAYGVTSRLELDAVVPVTLGQGGTGVSPVTGGPGIHDTATRDMRFGLSYALLPRPRIAPHMLGENGQQAFGVTGRLEFSVPMGDHDQFAGERAMVTIPSVSTEYRLGRFFFGGELGMRLRPTAELVGARIGTQGLVALGAGFDVLRTKKRDEMLTVLAEAFALPNLDEQHDPPARTPTGPVSTPNGKIIVPSEWAVSVRTAPLLGGDLGIQLGGGSSIPLGGDSPITTPRFRFTLSIRYAPMAHDSDGDGIPDKDDACPTEPEDRRGLRDGCPESAVGPSNAPQTPQPGDAPTSPSSTPTQTQTHTQTPTPTPTPPPSGPPAGAP